MQKFDDLPPLTRVYHLRSRDERITYPILSSLSYIGRAGGLMEYFAGCQEVANRHAYFIKDASGSVWVARTSVNPLTVNGKPLPLNMGLSRDLCVQLQNDDSLVIAGHQFDVLENWISVTQRIEPYIGTILSREKVSEYEGYYTYATGFTRYELHKAGQGEVECTVSGLSLPHRNCTAEAGGRRFSFLFPGNDEPTIVPGLRGYFIDLSTEQPLAWVEYKTIFIEPQEYLMQVAEEQIQIQIKRYFDGSFLFFRGQEKIAHFKRKYDPERKCTAFGDSFPMDYYAWCVKSLTALTRGLILSIPFIGHFGVSPNYRLEEFRQQQKPLSL